MEWSTFKNVENYINFPEFSTLQIFQFLLLRYFDAFLQQCLFHKNKTSPSNELFILPPSLHQIQSILGWNQGIDCPP